MDRFDCVFSFRQAEKVTNGRSLTVEELDKTSDHKLKRLLKLCEEDHARVQFAFIFQSFKQQQSFMV